MPRTSIRYRSLIEVLGITYFCMLEIFILRPRVHMPTNQSQKQGANTSRGDFGNYVAHEYNRNVTNTNVISSQNNEH